MRRRLVTALLPLLLFGGRGAAQVLDDTLVPAGSLRLQAHPSFTSWDTRYGIAPDGAERQEALGQDLTDSTGAGLFTGLAALGSYVESITGVPGYEPILGETRGRVTQDVNRIDFGAHLGVFDWLTVGVVVPWVETRTAVDLAIAPLDSAAAGAVGLSPTLTNAGAVVAYLAAVEGAATAALANTASACDAGPSPECTAAQALSDRAASFLGSARGAYGASAFFPLAGSAAAASLAMVSSALDGDLGAAGLTPIGLPMVFASDPLTSNDVLGLPFRSGSGIAGAPLVTRRSLWQAGDVELTGLIRLLERAPAPAQGAPRGVSYRLTVGALVRLPTGAPEDPDIFLDLGSGDAQTDYEGRVVGALGIGRLGLSVGFRYGVQGSTTLTKRVAPPEVPIPELSTRTSVRWSPASYTAFDLAPTLRLTDELALTAELRSFDKAADRYELVDPSLPLDAEDLARESAFEVKQVGAGLRYTTVPRWRAGEDTRPMEVHLRVIRTVAGAGGHTPVSTRIEAGLRLFRRFWGS